MKTAIFLTFGLLSGFVFYFMTTPEFALFRAGLAFYQKDQTSFGKTTDFDKIAVGLAEDFEILLLKSMGVDPSQGGHAASLLGLLTQNLKPEAIKLVQRVRQEHFSGTSSENGNSQIATLRGVLLFFISNRSDMKLKWKWETQRDETMALVTVFLRHIPTQKDFEIRFKLEKIEKQWKLIRIYNLIESYIAFETRS